MAAWAPIAPKPDPIVARRIELASRSRTIADAVADAWRVALPLSPAWGQSPRA